MEVEICFKEVYISDWRQFMTELSMQEINLIYIFSYQVTELHIFHCDIVKFILHYKKCYFLNVISLKWTCDFNDYLVIVSRTLY